MPITTRLLTSEWEGRWDSYVSAHADATMFHGLRWKSAIERQFRCSPRYMLAEENGTVRGVLPLFLFANRFIGRTLISTPFAVYGGICADDSASRDALMDAASKLANEERVEYLELRNREAVGADNLITKKLYVSFEQQLPDNEEALMKGYPRDTRYMVRKALKAGLSVSTDRDQMDVFYRMYATSVRNLGTPVFARKFFDVLAEEFGDNLELMVVRKDREPLAAVLSFTDGQWIRPYYGGSTLEARQYAANNYMYYALMKSAMERKIRGFDFGRSKLNSGSYSFKAQWNMTERELPYEYLLVRRKEMPNYSPANPKMKLATSVWKRMPLPLTNFVGPALVRLFP